MKPNKGFTLIELLIVLAIIGILAAIAIPHFQGKSVTTSSGTKLRLSTACIDGYKFSVDRHGNATQMFNSMGGGVTCSPTVER